MIVSTKMLVDLNSWKDGSKEMKQQFWIIIIHLILAIKKAKHLLLYKHTLL